MLKSLPTRLHEAITNHGGSPRPTKDQWMVRCPCHEDSTPSVAIKTTPDGQVLIHDHAGCQTNLILAAWGLTWNDILPQKRDRSANETWTPAGTASHTYDYVDEDGTLRYQVLRIPKPGGGKTFRQRRPDPITDGKWIWNLEGVEPIPYNLPAVIAAARDGETIHIVEGEKDADTLTQQGHAATTNSGGAGKWPDSFTRYFPPGTNITIIPDKDGPGRAHSRKIRDTLTAHGCNVTLAETADGTKDITHHMQAGNTLQDLQIITQTLPPDHDLITIHQLTDPTQPEPTYDWIIPNLLEHAERAIIVGPEGFGKTMYLRQIATFTAAGLHPHIHTDDPTPRQLPGGPKRVLWIDAENTRQQNRRAFTPLHNLTQMLQHHIPPNHFNFAIRPQGLDLHNPEDQLWLNERVHITKPDILIIGPWYRLFTRDPNDETITRQITQQLDNIRTTHNCAILIEAHTPHPTGNNPRPTRPIGSSLLLRWPEYGYAMVFPTNPDTRLPDPQTCSITPWRGPRDQREWPLALTRGTHPTHPPWLATNPPAAQSDNSSAFSDARAAYTNNRGGLTSS